MSDDGAWIVDRIRIGPGLVKKNGVLDVNQFDPRTTDASLVIPVAHGYTHAEGADDPIPGMLFDDDPRLTDARTPTAHAASHADGGTDEITVAQSQVTGLAAALAAILPAYGPADVAKSLTVLPDGSLAWIDAGATVPLTYDSIKTYDSALTYDEEFYS